MPTTHKKTFKKSRKPLDDFSRSGSLLHMKNMTRKQAEKIFASLSVAQVLAQKELEACKIIGANPAAPQKWFDDARESLLDFATLMQNSTFAKK